MNRAGMREGGLCCTNPAMEMGLAYLCQPVFRQARKGTSHRLVLLLLEQACPHVLLPVDVFFLSFFFSLIRPQKVKTLLLENKRY